MLARKCNESIVGIDSTGLSLGREYFLCRGENYQRARARLRCNGGAGGSSRDEGLLCVLAAKGEGTVLEVSVVEGREKNLHSVRCCKTVTGAATCSRRITAAALTVKPGCCASSRLTIIHSSK